MLELEFTASVREERPHFVAQCQEVDIASQGVTSKEALSNLREALELHLDRPVTVRKL